MGSGTTLLRLMLDSHPHIAIPPETGFMRAYKAHRHIPFKHSGRGWARRLGWTDDELDGLLRELYDTLFMRYAEQHGKRRWGEKTPIHTWHVDAMARLFPDARFVGIIRHPGAVVASNMRRWRHSMPKAAIHYDRYARELARQAARRPARFVVLRYEDLVLQPEPVMRELLAWLDEPWADEVLAHDEVQAARGGRRVVEGRTVVDDPIDVSRISRGWAAWSRSSASGSPPASAASPRSTATGWRTRRCSSRSPATDAPSPAATRSPRGWPCSPTSGCAAGRSRPSTSSSPTRAGSWSFRSSGSGACASRPGRSRRSRSGASPRPGPGAARGGSCRADP